MPYQPGDRVQHYSDDAELGFPVQGIVVAVGPLEPVGNLPALPEGSIRVIYADWNGSPAITLCDRPASQFHILATMRA